MAQIAELPLWMQVFVKTYRYRQAHWTHPAAVKPLRESRLALVTTAGLHTKEQQPFDMSMKGGDCSYRWIPGGVAVEELLIAHRSKAFDHSGIERDRNLCFPLDRFRELEAEGILGALNHRHLSMMGSITAPGRLLRQTAPEVAEQMQEDGVDAAFLVPV